MTDELKTRRAPRSSAAPSTPDAVEIAMEAVSSEEAPGGAALEVLRTNAALARAQIQLAEEQIGLARNERFRNRIKAIRDISLSAVVLAVVAGGVLTLSSAAKASGLVVEALTVPPRLVERGMDGKVLAGRLLDRLSAMQAETDSSRAPATFGNNWGDNLSVEVPQTGMSAGEFWRMLRQTLGNETRLSGDLVEVDGRLILTTRMGSSPGVSIAGGPAELDRLLDEAAESVYREAQPYRYAVWLNRRSRGGNAEILKELAASGNRTEQLWARVGQSVNAYRTDPELALDLGREALALDPSFHKARWNVSDALDQMGRDEEALRERRLIERAMRRRDQRVTEVAQNQVLYWARAEIATFLADYANAIENRRIQAGLPDYGGNARRAPYAVVEAQVALHDMTAARLSLNTANRIAAPLPEYATYITALATAERGDHVAAADLVRTALSIDDREGAYSFGPRILSSMAVMLVRGGDRAGGGTLLAAMRPDCYSCTIARGEVAVIDGNTTEAERLFTRATAMGPSLPTAWQALGRARLLRGDRAGATVALAEAHERGPRWADPLKYWGDALMSQGNVRGAIRRYSQAAERAPRWGALHLAWGRALEADGKRDGAMAKYADADRMDLSAADSAEVARRLGAVSRGS